MQMITIKDISRKCGVSPSTVSRALADSPLLPKTTKTRIQRAAEEMGYVKNEMATSLKTGVRRTVGVVNFVGQNLGFAHYLFSEILNGFSTYINDIDYDILLISDKTLQMGENLIPYLKSKQLGGVLILSGYYDSQGLRQLIGSDIPVVVVDPREEILLSMADCVSSDNYSGMYELTSEIISKGHKNVVFVTGEDYYVTHERVKGFKKALADNAIPFSDQMIVRGNFYNLSAVADNVLKILSYDNNPTCIIFSDDYCAVNAYEVLRRQGLTVGQDISVAGFDGIEMGKHMSPKLTTVVQDAETMGTTAAKTLVDRMNGAEKSDTKLIPTGLFLTESVKDLN